MNRFIGRREVLNTGLAFGTSLLGPAVRAHEFFTVNLTVLVDYPSAE